MLDWPELNSDGNYSWTVIIFKCTIISTYTAPKEKGEIVTACGNSITMAKAGRRGKSTLQMIQNEKSESTGTNKTNVTVHAH